MDDQDLEIFRIMSNTFIRNLQEAREQIRIQKSNTEYWVNIIKQMREAQKYKTENKEYLEEQVDEFLRGVR